MHPAQIGLREMPTRRSTHYNSSHPRLACRAPRIGCAALTTVAILGGLAGLACAGEARSDALSPATFVALSSSVVRVEAGRPGAALSIGSGVTVAPSVVVTNCHVTRDATAIRISGSGRLWDATEERADTLHDLCFLRVPEWRGRPVVLGATDALRPGQRVAALGFTGGTAISLRFGHVLALHTLEQGRVVESDAAFTSGSSGGGLFDAAGELVGLLTFRSRDSGGSYYSLPAEWIRDRLPTQDQWQGLGPLRGPPPFWQGDTETLPYFMRVSLLETEGRWSALLDLAERWSSVAPQDAEPLLARGRALQELERPRAAARAFSAAVRLTPDDPAAWYGLAIAHAVLGNEVELRDARTRLGVLDEKLAADLELELARMHGIK
jgi:hypothetical protein